MVEIQKKEEFSYDIINEGDESILRVDANDLLSVPSIEDNDVVMAKTCDLLIENPHVTKMIFNQKRDYEYDIKQTSILMEIAKIYNELAKQKNIFSYTAIGNTTIFSSMVAEKFVQIQNMIFNTLKRDPVGFYVQLTRILRKEKIELEKLTGDEEKIQQRFVRILEYLQKIMENTQLINIAKKYLPGYVLGNRNVYRKIFSPMIRPDFMFTKLMATYPKKAVEIANYDIFGTEVLIFDPLDDIQKIYHITPPEFRLSEDKYEILDTAREIMSKHKPEEQEFIDPERMRQVFYNIGKDLIERLAIYKSIKLKPSEIEEMTNILVRYTVGFGLIEVLLEDQNIQDITVNSPMGHSPIYLVHAEFGNCKTNIFPSMKDGESWASKLRMISGRPLDEANPILDTEILIPGKANARVGAISKPLNPYGVAFAFRRHRDKPWTLPLFIKQKMITPLCAGLMSFIIDGNRTILVAGTRSAGKTSLLGSLMVEIMRKYRIITIEDTLELPTVSLRKLGYNLQPMKVASVMTKGSSEISAGEGIRTTLRLGDSALIVGEVRSEEAKALYEAMRVGALANVVAGTIHGDSPYGVYDRVVNDLKVPKTSFKATDLIIVANPIKSGLESFRRVTQITEVRKKWEDDPLLEHGFVDLMKYNAKKDLLEPSDDLINGDVEILKNIAGNVKEWAGDWNAVWDNILLRADVKQAIVDIYDATKNPSLLEAPFVIKANDQFHKISDNVKHETGGLDRKRIFSEWNDWLRRNVKEFV
ncbi:MAG: type II/IV secretion system ATPase subunit [Candidatus Woesearchaeota archaeon]